MLRVNWREIDQRNKKMVGMRNWTAVSRAAHGRKRPEKRLLFNLNKKATGVFSKCYFSILWAVTFQG